MKISKSSTVLRAALLICLLTNRCQSFQPASIRTSAVQRSVDPSSARRIHRNSHRSVAPVSRTRLEVSLLSAAGFPAGAFLVLTGIIVIHEAGHYLAARSYGIKVEEFAIGFGPKLFGFTAVGNEFNLRAIPLGGYVRFPENYNVTLVNELERDLRTKYQEQRQAFQQEQGFETAIVAKSDTVGYKIANFLFLGVMEKKRKKEEEALRLRQQEEEKKKSWWKSVVPVKKSTLPPKVFDPEDIPIDYYDDPDLLQNRPWLQRVVVLSGGVVFNLLLAFSIYFGEISTTGLPRPVFDQGIVVSQNPIQEGAANGILRKGDVVVGVNGKLFAMSQSPSAAAAQEAISNLISTIRATPDGDSLSVSVIRGQGADPVDLAVQPKRLQANGPKSIGVVLSPNFVRTEIIQVDNPVQAVAPAAQIVSSMTTDTAVGLTKFFVQTITGQDTGGQQVSGPIGLIKTGSEVVSTQDWSTVLAFAAAVSVNLGVVNALPLPALDGGQLVFVVAELFTGKKIDQRRQEEIISITVLLLVFVSASAAFGDVQSLILKR